MLSALTSAFLAAFCALSMEGRGMNIAARNAMLVKGGWKNPYITDGLVSMWDGEWNAGPGMHSSDTLTWKDLSGNDNDLIVRLASLWGNNSLYCDGNSWSAYRTGGINYQTIECVYQTVSFKTIKNDTSGTRTIFYGATSSRLLNTPELRTDQRYETSIPRASVELYSINSVVVVGIATANDGETHQICGIYNDATTGTPKNGYFNGQRHETYTRWNWGIYSDTVVGDRQIDAQGWPWNGNVNAVRLYSRALTADEIAANYAVDKARFNLP